MKSRILVCILRTLIIFSSFPRTESAKLQLLKYLIKYEKSEQQSEVTLIFPQKHVDAL